MQEAAEKLHLLPCPFCGADEDYLKIEQVFLGKDIVFAVKCKFCGALGPYAEDAEGASLNWNRGIRI